MTKVEKFISAIPPFPFLLRISRLWSPPGFQGMTLYDVMLFFRQKASKIGFNTRAAAASFNVLMALPAGLIFLCTLVPYLPSVVQFEKELLRILSDLMKNKNTYLLLANIIHDFFTTQRGSLLSFSFLAAIYFSSNAMMGIMQTFDRSYFEERGRGFFTKRITAIRLTALLVLLILVIVLLMAMTTPVRTFLIKKMHWNKQFVYTSIYVFRWICIVAFNYFSVAFIYRWAPAVRNRWPLHSTGTILATVLTITTSWLFSAWVNNFGRFNEVYGSIGTVLILMNLVYINSLILLIGFELNVSITALKMKKKE